MPIFPKNPTSNEVVSIGSKNWKFNSTDGVWDKIGGSDPIIVGSTFDHVDNGITLNGETLSVDTTAIIELVGIAHAGDANTKLVFGTDTVNIEAGGYIGISMNSSTVEVGGVTLGAGGITFGDGTAMSTAFTTTLKGKLDGIEASADVTDATNVASAGALMDSELTSIADVKALDQSVVSGASPAFGTANFTDASNKRLMTDAQESKLDGVEASADVTDTANVTSSGALMDSELTSIADVKALNQSVVSGANPVFTIITALAGISVGAGGVTFNDGTQTTTALRKDAYTGHIETVADKVYYLDPDVATDRTITGFFTDCASGTCTGALRNHTDGVTIKSASISTSGGSHSGLANTSIAAGDQITISISSNSSCLDLIFNVEFTTAS